MSKPSAKQVIRDQQQARIQGLLQDLESKHGLTAHQVLHLLQSLLIHSANRYFERSYGLFSNIETYLAIHNHHKMRVGVPERVHRLMKLLSGESDFAGQITAFYQAMMGDSRIYHSNWRDKKWDEIKANLDAWRTGLTVEDVRYFGFPLMALGVHIDYSVHDSLKGMKDVLVGDRDIIDGYLKEICEILNAPDVETMYTRLEALAKDHKIPMPKASQDGDVTGYQPYETFEYKGRLVGNA